MTQFWLVPSVACIFIVACGPPAAPWTRANPRPAAELAAPIAIPVEGVELRSPEVAAPAAVPVIRIALSHEREIDDAVRRAITAGRLPGCVVVLGRRDGTIFRRAYGRRAIEPESEPMTLDTVFDLASITKSVATATALMILADRGRLAIDDPVVRHVPAFGANGKEAITVEQLLLHVGGLDAVNPLAEYAQGREEALASIYGSRTPHRRGARYVYSDLGFIVLGEVVAAASGEPLDVFTHGAIFEPLGMGDTGFLPGPAAQARSAPTEERAADALDVPGVPTQAQAGSIIRGTVNDPRAFRLGGVAGNAGLFSTADDLSRFARALLGGGSLDGARVLSAEGVREMTTARGLAGGNRRTLGWDGRSRSGLSSTAFGHGGYTGTSLWVDPELDLFVLVLSNRVHPEGRGDARRLIRAIEGIAARAVASAADPEPSGGEPVLAGIDVLRRDGFTALRGARVGLITNASGRARDGRTTLALLHAAPEVSVVTLFAPEHGLDADREGSIASGREADTGLRVHSLFGPTRAPTEESLRGVDTLVFDIQDVGVRFYTYASTMLKAMEVAAERDLRFVVLDRPNPLGGGAPSGPVLEDAQRSFVNYHALPVRHGMSLGELAQLLNAEREVGARLEVVRAEGWGRSAQWEDTGLRWVPPSPNLRTPAQVRLYPAVGLLESTNVSVGRGTDTPFEVLGAPWIDGEALATRIGAAGLPGVSAEATRFVPRAGPHRGRRCTGVRLTVTDRQTFRPVRTGLALAGALVRLHPDRWDTGRLARMVGRADVVEALVAGRDPAAIEADDAAALADFARVRADHLLY